MSSAPESLEAIACDADFTIRRDGVWLYNGSPIARERLVKLFVTVLKRDAQGVYWLQTPVEKCRIAVEDMPFLIVDMQVEASGEAQQEIYFTTNLDESVPLDRQHPLQLDETGPYIELRDGLCARLSRPVYYRLADMVLRHGEGASASIRSFGQDFLLSRESIPQ